MCTLPRQTSFLVADSSAELVNRARAKQRSRRDVDESRNLLNHTQRFGGTDGQSGKIRRDDQSLEAAANDRGYEDGLAHLRSSKSAHRFTSVEVDSGETG